MANAEVLPFTFGPWSKTVSAYLKEVMQTADKMRKEVEEHNIKVKENHYVNAADPTKPMAAPTAEESVPYLDFSPLQNALVALESEITALNKNNAHSLDPKRTLELNKLLMQSEHQLTSVEGLPRRPWYKHQIYAPGFYTGYGVKTLPGVREAIEQKDWKEAQEEIGKLTETFSKLTEHLKKINQLFS
jgi:N-acetylated-alpha-linked acidic dipeptidase